MNKREKSVDVKKVGVKFRNFSLFRHVFTVGSFTALSRVPVAFTFGDQSGSHSEKYRLELTPVQTAGADGSPRSFTWTDAQYGVCETKTALLMRGCSYELRMFHAGTREGDESDYDYSLSVSYPQGAGVIVSDPSELIRADDQTSDYFSGEGKVVTIKVLNPSLVFCKPEDGDWSELEESRVVLDNEKLKIKISVSPKLETKAQCIAALGGSLMLRTSGTCPSGVVVPLDSDAEWDAGGTGFSAIKITKTMTQLKALGLLPSQNGDGVAEKATLDMGAGDIASDSNLSDSREFLGLGAEFRGDANNGIEGDLTSQPPVSLPSESFFKAAGSEVIYAEYAGAVAEPKQVMNQADYFYYSGHGYHETGTIQGGFTPSMAASYWNRDLDCAIIAGCAVLDVRNFRFNSLGLLYRWKNRSWKGAYPGELWEETGVKCLLGYALKAPLDADGGSSISAAFAANINSGKGVIMSWRDANDNSNGRNACVIDCSKTPHEFWYWNESSGSPIWTKVTKGATSW